MRGNLCHKAAMCTLGSTTVIGKRTFKNLTQGKQNIDRNGHFHTFCLLLHGGCVDLDDVGNYVLRGTGISVVRRIISYWCVITFKLSEGLNKISASPVLSHQLLLLFLRVSVVYLSLSGHLLPRVSSML